MFLLLLSCLGAIVGVLSNPAITLMKCESGDDQCVTEAVRAAFPLILEANEEIGAESMDPLYQEEIEGTFAVLNYKLLKTNTEGYKLCQVEKATFDDVKLRLHIDLRCPSFVLNGQYEISGTLVVIPVEGNGDYSIVTKTYEMGVDAELKLTEGKDGKKYLTVKNFKSKTEPLEPIIFDFKNLFNGQKDLAEGVIKFANENWKQVANEVEEPIFTANIKKLIKNANKYLKTVPVEDYLKL